jgi:DNA-binding SARP family transcriptional activator
LLDLLWQDMEPDRARNNLNVAISAIRRAMSDGSVVEFDRGRATYGFNCDRDLWVDVIAFEQHIARARAAQGSGNIEGAVHAYQLAGQLYVGDLLADQPYEAWIESERNDLRRRWLDGLGALGRLLHDAGQTDEAIWSFEHATRIDPFDEAALQKWMSAVADRGQWRRALEAYERYRIKLSDELGLLPSRALRTTADEIMASAGVLSA